MNCFHLMSSISLPWTTCHDADHTDVCERGNTTCRPAPISVGRKGWPSLISYRYTQGCSKAQDGRGRWQPSDVGSATPLFERQSAAAIGQLLSSNVRRDAVTMKT